MKNSLGRRVINRKLLIQSNFPVGKKKRKEEEDEGWRSCRTAGYVITIKAKGRPLCSQDIANRDKGAIAATGITYTECLGGKETAT